ncbi:MAG: hypothetical protein KME26_22315 [Oscillatoria princeps RMCB-10]|jgi:DNA-binding helix-hairpin-helix protein with protein kinase domain|nr:hypothetical protein [Oscillatoria princeps RMCB-10]
MPKISLLPGSRNLPKQLEIGDKPARTGGEGKIYFTADDCYAVKIYHRPSPDKKKLLQQILPLGNNLGEAEQFLAWPLGIAEKLDSEECVGCITRRIPKSYVELFKLTHSPRNVREQFQQGHTWMNYLKMARSIAAAVHTLHGKGMAHADIQWRNFLADISTGEAVLIDLDGLVVKGFLPPQVLGVHGFIAPEVEMGLASPSETTDRHSAAVLILWTLLFRNVMEAKVCYDDENEENDQKLSYGKEACFSENPNDRRNWLPNTGMPLFRGGALSFRMLTPKLRELTVKALIQGLHEPSFRPQVREWERALAEAYDVLVKCPACGHSYLYPYWLQPPQRRQCPFCGTSDKPPFPVVIELLDLKIKGIYTPARPAVLYGGLPLFADIIEPGGRPPFTRRSNVPVLGHTEWDAAESVFRLVNESDTLWPIVTGGSGAVKPGQSVALRRGLVLSFGDGKRLARVVE